MDNATFQIDLAAFDAGTPDGDTVRRSGLLFRAGEYPDKRFAATADDLRRIVAEFTPAPVNLDHTTVPKLANRLGRLEHVWLSPDGNELHGRIAIPKALESLAGSTAGSGVSMEFDRQTKRIVGIALTDNPRVDGAAVFSQEDSMPDNEEKGLLDWLKEKFKSEKAAPAADKAEPTSFTKADEKAEDPRIAEFTAKVAKLEADNAAALAAAKAVQFTAQAEAMFNAYLAAGKALPAEKPAMVAAFTQALKDDDANQATVTFGKSADGKDLTGSRLDAIKALFDARQPHALFTERIVPEGATVVDFGKGYSGELSDAEKRKLDSAMAKGKAPAMKKGA